MPVPPRRLPAGILGLLLFLAASAAGADARTDALVRLCEVWSTVKFHDPQLMLRQVDWDGALVRAIPKVRQAQTSDEVAQAIAAMLAELGDPVTRVFRKHTASPTADNVPLLLRWEGDVLVVNIGPYTDSVSEEALLFSAVEQIAAELAKAKVAVFDFRTRSGDTPGWILDNLDLTGEEVAVPAWRHVVHSGYTPQAGPAIGGFHSSLEVVLPRPIAGSGGTVSVPKRTVFIVGDGLPERAAALWWSGRAAIVSEYPVLDAYIARTKRIDLGDGWIAAVRVTESIAQGIAADAVVASNSQADVVMAKAIALARDPASLPARPAPQLKATAPIAQTDAAYAEMSYPDLPYRLLGLFRLWSVVDRFYPFKD